MAREMLGDTLMGVVLNRVTSQSLPEVEQIVVPFLASKGIEVLGVIPLDRLLDAVTVRQLVEILQGKVICGEAALDEFVERFSVGAMDTGAALATFNAFRTRRSSRAETAPTSSSPLWRPRLAAWCSRATRCRTRSSSRARARPASPSSWYPTTR